jgi:hypothetical protein
MAEVIDPEVRARWRLKADTVLVDRPSGTWQVTRNGATVISSLSLAVERLRVIVRIDGVDVSRAHDNDGPDPWFSLVPVNRSTSAAR